MSLYFNDHNLRIASAASKELTRLALTAVAFFPTRTVASDGRRLVEVTAPPDQQAIREEHPLKAVVDQAAAWKWPLLVPAEACKEFARKLPRKSFRPELTCGAIEQVETDEGGQPKRVVLASTDGSCAQRMQIELVDANYPDIDQVKPALGRARGILALDLDMLIDTLRAMKIGDNGRDLAPLVLTVYEDRITLRVNQRGGGQTAYAIQMAIEPEAALTAEEMKRCAEIKAALEPPPKEEAQPQAEAKADAEGEPEAEASGDNDAGAHEVTEQGTDDAPPESAGASTPAEEAHHPDSDPEPEEEEEEETEEDATYAF